MGIAGAYAHIDNSYPYVTKNQSGWGIGGVGKVGSLVFIKNNFYVDFFTKYTYLPLFFDHSNDKTLISTHNAYINGFSIGAGIGYVF